MLFKRSSLVVTTVGLLLFGSPTALVGVLAQDLQFEQVGDIPIDADDLEFDQEGTLWAGANELWRLPAGMAMWEEVYDEPGSIGSALLVLSPDTLFLGSNGGQSRSTDGGKTFFGVYDNGPEQFGASITGPNQGVILVGTFGSPAPGIAYSTDRGASFTEATFTVSGSSTRFMESAVEILDGSAEGRLVAGVFGGVVISENSGQTWSPSSLFQDARFWVQRVVIGTAPGTGNRRLYATLADATLPTVQFYYSDDDGLTWTNVPDMEDAFLFVYVPQADGYLLAVERGYDVQTERIELWRSDDGGQSWTDAGQLPAIPDGLLQTTDMLIGPDSHVYVSVTTSGPEHEWVYRTTEPVVVANEPEITPGPMAERLLVYPNPAGDYLTVESSTVEIEIVDVLGRVVLRTKSSERVDVSGLSVGVYVVRAGKQNRVITIRR